MAKTAEKLNKVTEAKAHAMNVRISPRKMRLITNLVKNMWADEAIVQLRFTSKRGATDLADVIRSAVANATNNFKMDKDALYIKSITCDGGPKLKRYMPRAQGRATEIRRPTSHIHVVLAERTSGKKRSGFSLPEKQKETKQVEMNEEKNEAQQKGKITSSQTEKTSEQTKTNKIQLKRRLFNRKSGV